MRTLVFVLALACLCTATPAQAQGAARDAAFERQIEAQLAAIAPGALPTFQAATRAYDAENLPEATTLYRQVLVQAPDFVPALRRLGAALCDQGFRESGLGLLAQALRHERSPENLYVMAKAIAFPGRDAASNADLRRALGLIREALVHPEARSDADYRLFQANVAALLEDTAELRTAVAALRAEYPEQYATHYFSAILHAADGEWRAAEREIHTAEQLGLPQSAALSFLDSGVRSRARASRAFSGVVLALLVWATGLLLLFIAGRLLSGVTLRSIADSDPGELASSTERSLRRVYRALIRSAAIYYYLSLPFVAVLVLATTAAVFYVFELLGWIPIQLAAALAVAALVTLYRMGHSLFKRIEAPDPGRSLRPAEAPGLWDLTRTVADEIGTRTIDDIRVTPGTELAVYEQGTARERARDEARRTLILGTGVLNGFSQGAFRAVLAHEYGHFAHRDTAGGDVALRVNQDMMKFAVGMAQHGQAVWWNVAFQFLRVYHFIFRRISHGATRLQEVMADRVAAHKYGAPQFEQGLRHVIRASIEFNAAVTRELQDALQLRRPFQNLYTLAPGHSDDIEFQVRDAIERPTTEDDTHPGPLERFRLVNRITADRQWDNPAPVWDLFVDREALTKEMTAVIEANVHAVTGVSV